MAGIIATPDVQGKLSENPPPEAPSPSTPSPFFLAVRARGLLNAMLDVPTKQFEDGHPGLGTYWAFAPANGDTTFVVAREAMGYRVVNHEELGFSTPNSKKGPVRVGDLLMMCAPTEIIREQELADAQAAADDLKLPEITYRQHLEALQVQKRTGEVFSGRAIGNVRHHVEEESINIGREVK